MHSLWKTLWICGNAETRRLFATQCPKKSPTGPGDKVGDTLGRTWGLLVDNVWTSCEQAIWDSSRVPFTPWTTCGNLVDNPWMKAPRSGDSLCAQTRHPQAREFSPGVTHTPSG